MNVLYVEDDPFDADLTRRALLKTAPHFNLVVARTQSEALAHLNSGESYDLLLTDLRLPDGSGFSLLSYVRERELPLAVVVITGQGDEEIAVSVLKAGADDYLVKRQNYLDHLATTLENGLQRHQAEFARRQRSLRILYLENNPTDIELTQRHFASHAPHIHLEIVHSNVQVFQKLPGGKTQVEYDAMLLDYRWQELNALDLLKELRQIRGLDLPIILVTNQGDEEVAAQALRLGANDYVVKSSGYLFRLPGLLENAYHRAQLLREQAALRVSEERFRRLAENAPDMIFRSCVNPPYRVEYVSPAVATILGYTPQAIYSDPYIFLNLVHADDQALFQEMLRGNVSGPTPTVLRYYRENGSLVWLETRSVPVFDHEGKLVAVDGFARDVTERKQAEEQIHRQLERLNTLRTVDTAISASLDLRTILDVLLERVILQLGVHAADVLLFNSQTGKLKFRAGKGFHLSTIESLELSLGEGHAGQAALQRCTIHIPNQVAFTKQVSGFSDLLIREGFVAYIGTPLVVKSQVKGVLEVYHRRSLEPDPEWINFFETLAGQAAIAIDNAELFEESQHANRELIQAYDRTLEGWIRFLDLRDHETENHTQRVTEKTIELARKLDVGEALMLDIRRGALLHDIGKMAVPDNILHKPGPLTDEEWVTMRMHPVIAYEILSQIDYLCQALEIPYCHHEKWDGTGYPRGLRGEEIPLAARIFAVVDVWDALSSDRPYRPRWEPEKVMDHIRSQSGTHFDPQVVEKFLELAGNGREKWKTAMLKMQPAAVHNPAD